MECRFHLRHLTSIWYFENTLEEISVVYAWAINSELSTNQVLCYRALAAACKSESIITEQKENKTGI